MSLQNHEAKHRFVEVKTPHPEHMKSLVPLAAQMALAAYNVGVGGAQVGSGISDGSIGVGTGWARGAMAPPIFMILNH